MSMLFSIAEGREARSVRHLKISNPAKAGGLVAEVFREARAEYLLAAPLLLHSPTPDLLHGFWSVFRATLLTGALPRRAKEIIAVEIARQNRCPYCEEAHSLSLQAIGPSENPEDRDRDSEVIAWCRATAGGPEAPLDKALLASPPFERDETIEALGLLLVFHYLNRMVTLFCPESVVQLPRYLEALRNPMRRAVRLILGFLLRREVVPRDNPEPTALTTELAWAAPRPQMAQALRDFFAKLDEIERRLPEGVRDLVREELASWQGEELALTSSWPESRLDRLDEPERAMAAFALRVTRCAYRVTEDEMLALRETGMQDAQLLELAAWSAAAAARRILSWSLPSRP